MIILYKGKRYYWDIKRFKENMFNALMFIGGILCWIIGSIIL